MGEVELEPPPISRSSAIFFISRTEGSREDELPVRQWTQRDARFYGLEERRSFHLLESEGLSF